jgi:hypothetical protein
MEVIFYYNASDDRVINKTLIGGQSFVGVPRDEINVMSPIIRFDSPEILRYNYAYIPELQRYYTVDSATAFREGLWDISFSVDVLMSFRGDIMPLSVIVDRQSMAENGDEYIDDGSLVADNVMFTRLHQFESGFNDYPEYILITAG